MKSKLYLSCILSCFVFLFTSCNEATPEQIKETELATKKEQLLEEMHEEEVKELVNVLTEKAKDNSFYYFVNLGKNAEKVKDNPYYNIFNEDKGYALKLLTDKIKELPEYIRLRELHKEYHNVLWDVDYENMSDEEFNDFVMIQYSELCKWHIENNKIKSQKDLGKYEIIENTVCPFCRPLIDSFNPDENADFDYYDYVIEYHVPCNFAYFDKYKLFGYYLAHPEENIENYENIVKYIEKYFEAYELPLYKISTLLKEYKSGLEKAKTNDEFGINGEVTNYRKSWNKKVVRVKGKIINITKTYDDVRYFECEDSPRWEITVDSDGYEMHLYFDYFPEQSSRLGGTVPVEKDIIKLKKNDEIMFITEMFTNSCAEWNSYFPVITTDLHFGYSEILEINGVGL